MSDVDGWRRVHPLSPLVRGGRATIAVAIVLLPALVRGGNLNDSFVQFVVAGVLTCLGFVSWLVTRWRIDSDDLQIETGLLRRRSLRFPLSQVQAVDIVRPGLARLFRVAELRLRMGGASGATARLAYLPEREVEPLRATLLALAEGARLEERVTEAGSPLEPVAEERVLTTVPTARLAGSILISDVGLFAEAVDCGSRRHRHPGPSGRCRRGQVRSRLDLRGRDRRMAALQPGVPADAGRGARWSACSVGTGGSDRGDDPAGPCPGCANGRAAAVASAGLVSTRGRSCRAAALEGRRPGAAQSDTGSASGRKPSGCRGAARAHRPGQAGRTAAAAGARAVEEPAAVPHARLGAHRHVRRDHERATSARHLLGSAREGAELPSGARTCAAPVEPGECARGHSRPQRPRDTSRPRRRRGRPDPRAPHRPRPGGSTSADATRDMNCLRLPDLH